MCLAIAQAMAQDNPSINPTAEFTDSEQKTEEGTEYSGSAPVVAHFKANASNVGAWNAYYEWRFWQEGEDGSKDSPYLIRYEEDTDYTFTKAGTHSIVLHAIFTQGNDTIAFTQDYWDEVGPLRVTISESKLDMPNGFSPNGDGINDIYKAKEGYQSLVEFRAIIFNRTGRETRHLFCGCGGQGCRRTTLPYQARREPASGIQRNRKFVGRWGRLYRIMIPESSY